MSVTPDTPNDSVERPLSTCDHANGGAPDHGGNTHRNEGAPVLDKAEKAVPINASSDRSANVETDTATPVASARAHSSPSHAERDTPAHVQVERETGGHDHVNGGPIANVPPEPPVNDHGHGRMGARADSPPHAGSCQVDSSMVDSRVASPSRVATEGHIDSGANAVPAYVDPPSNVGLAFPGPAQSRADSPTPAPPNTGSPPSRAETPGAVDTERPAASPTNAASPSSVGWYESSPEVTAQEHIVQEYLVLTRHAYNTKERHGAAPAYTSISSDRRVMPFTNIVEGSLVPDRAGVPSELPRPSWHSLGLPLTQWPYADSSPRPAHEQNEAAWLVHGFHMAAREGNTRVMDAMIARGLVSPDVPSAWGHTALIMAIDVGNTDMARYLISLGADVNHACGLPAPVTDAQFNNASLILAMGQPYNHWPAGPRADRPLPKDRPVRTPLMVAAARGRLTMVKLLLELGADDAYIAPDGQTALRLAAAEGHRDVVDFLPLRRGGGFRRWQTAHAVAIRRVRKAAKGMYWFVRILVFEIPRLLVWYGPKELVVLPLWRLAKATWKARHSIATDLRECAATLGLLVRDMGRLAWAGVKAVPRVLTAVPAKIREGAHAMGRGLKKLPAKIKHGVKAAASAAKRAAAAVLGALSDAARWVWRVLQAAPGHLARAARAVWRALVDYMRWWWEEIKAVPGQVKALGLALWSYVKTAGAALGSVATSLVSLLHSVLEAIVSFFRRVSLRDIWAGVVAALHALFVALPRRLWDGLAQLICRILDGWDGLLGGIFAALVTIAYGVLWVALYVPRKIVQMVVALGTSLRQAGVEVLVYFNPKR